MREIKFRAWNIDQEYMISDAMVLTDESIMTRSNNHYDSTEKVIWMQYTGLKDKNGKEIYEGDIRVAFGQHFTYLQVIEFHNTNKTCGRGWIGRNIAQIDTVEWNLNKKVKIKQNIDGFSYFGLPSGGEIIGNIHQNTELLT